MHWPIKDLISKDFFLCVFGEVYAAGQIIATHSNFSEYLAAFGHTYYHFANFGRHYYEIDRHEVPGYIYEHMVSVVAAKIETGRQ